jgi:hypothetical protein
MTLIEIRPHRWGWKALEVPGVEPVFQRDRANRLGARAAAAMVSARRNLSANGR